MKKFLILILLLTSISTLSCGSGGAGPANLPAGENTGIASVIRLLAAQYIAQVNASIYLRARVLDGNGLPVTNKTVTFTNLSTLGTLSSSSAASRASSSTSFTAVTDSNGIASAKLDSTSQGFVTIQATMDSGAGQIIAKNTFYFSTYSLTYPTTSTTASTLWLDVDTDCDNIYSDKEPDDYIIKSSCNNQAGIRATILDSSNMPVANITVTFGSDSTSATFPQGITKTTDKNGQAINLVSIASSVITPYTTPLNITASAANGAANMTTLFLNPVVIDTNTSHITATSSTIALNGTSEINAVVMLNTGAAAPDATTVNFTTTCGTVTPFAQTTAGVATATFTAPPIPAICIVKATAGGTTVGTVNITATDALTVQPTAKTVSGLTGGTVSFTIAGGSPSYSIFSSDAKFPASVSTVSSSNGTFSVTVPANSANTTVTYTVRDSAGATVNATLTITTDALTVQPTAKTVSGLTGGTVSFTIAGGSPSYSIFSSDAKFPASVSTVSSSNGTFSVTVPANSANTTVTYTVMDTAGATVNATLTITTPALSVSPSSQIILDYGTAQFTIADGAPPYQITSSDTTLKPSTSTVASSGGTFTVTVASGTKAKTVVYTVIDSVGTVVTSTLTVTVTPVTPVPVTALAISPAAITVNAGSSTKFTIIGGTQPYTTTSTDPNNAYDSAPGDGVWSGSSVTVTVPANAPAGLVTLNVYDSAGDTVSAKLNILGAVSTVMTVNPSTMTLTGLSSTLDTATFVIAGGTPPYSVYSSNLVVIPQPSFDVSGTKFTINPNPVAVDTIVTLTVMDNTGATKTVPVTVTPSTASLGINPSTVSMMSGGIVQFNIFGGTGGPLQIVSDSASATIANAACTANGTGVLNCPAGTTSFTVTAGIPTTPPITAIITVIDVNGNVSAISTVTIN